MLRSSKLINKSDAQKQMIEPSFGCKFHDLVYFKGGCFFIFLEFIIHFKVLSQKIIENHQFNVLLF
jgi:hypothetical protein